MRSSSSVSVIRRNLRWEVLINGKTRPILDWFVSEERALDAARKHARDLGIDVVALVLGDGSVDSWVSAEGERFSRYSRAM